jgi:hypothetical protein
MIKDLPDNTEFGVRSPMGSIEVEFKAARVFGNQQGRRFRPIDFVFEALDDHDRR